jgi:hypothetical protein
MEKIKYSIILLITLIGILFLTNTAYAGDSGTWYSKDKSSKVSWHTTYYNQDSSIEDFVGEIKKYKKTAGKYKLVKMTSYGAHYSNYQGKDRLKVAWHIFHIPYNGSSIRYYKFIYTSLSPIQYYKKSYRTSLLKTYGVLSTPDPYTKIIDKAVKYNLWNGQAGYFSVYLKTYQAKDGSLRIEGYQTNKGGPFTLDYKCLYYVNKNNLGEIRIKYVSHYPGEGLGSYITQYDKKIALNPIKYYWKYLRPYLLHEGLYDPVLCYPKQCKKLISN